MTKLHTREGKFSNVIQDEIMMFQDIIDRILYLPESEKELFLNEVKGVIKGYDCRSTTIISDDELMKPM